MSFSTIETELARVKQMRHDELKSKYLDVIMNGSDFAVAGTEELSGNPVTSVRLVGGDETENGLRRAYHRSDITGKDAHFSTAYDVMVNCTPAEMKQLYGTVLDWGDGQWKRKRAKQIYIKSLATIEEVLAVTWDSEEPEA